MQVGRQKHRPTNHLPLTGLPLELGSLCLRLLETYQYSRRKKAETYDGTGTGDASAAGASESKELSVDVDRDGAAAGAPEVVGRQDVVNDRST